MVLLLFLVTMSVAAFLFWRGETREASEAALARTFEESAQTMTRALLDARAAQQAYVANGQDAEENPESDDNDMSVGELAEWRYMCSEREKEQVLCSRFSDLSSNTEA